MKEQIQEILEDTGTVIALSEDDNDILNLIIRYNETQSMFKISKKDELNKSIEAIKSIIKGEVQFKEE